MRTWTKGIPGEPGSGQLGPADVDGRHMIAGSEYGTTRRAYCHHTGHDYWPRPCDACLAKSEQGRRAS